MFGGGTVSGPGALVGWTQRNAVTVQRGGDTKAFRVPDVRGQPTATGRPRPVVVG